MSIIQPRWLVSAWVIAFVATMTACVSETIASRQEELNLKSFRFFAFYVGFWPRPSGVKDKSTTRFDPCYDRNGVLTQNPR